MTNSIQAVQAVIAVDIIPASTHIAPLPPAEIATPDASAPVTRAKTAGVPAAANDVGSLDAKTMAELVALLGIGATATSSTAADSVSGLQTLPAIIANALDSILAENSSLSFASGADMLTVNQTLTHQSSHLLDTPLTGVVSSVAESILSPTDVLQGLPSHPSAAAFESLLSADPGLASTPANATVRSLQNQLAQVTAQTAAAIGATGAAPATPLAAAASTPAAPPALAAVPLSGPAPPLTAAPAAVSAAAVTPAAVAATGKSATTSAGLNAGSTATAVDETVSNVNQDFLAQAIATISSDPAYAATAASLYANAAIFRSQQAADVALTIDSIALKPVSPVSTVKAVRGTVE